jgi:lysophospholipase L1-like esterase
VATGGSTGGSPPSTGGVATGGKAAATGGIATGGISTGGTSTGGTSTGGTSTGGSAVTGGTPGTGGSAAGAPAGGVSAGGSSGAPAAGAPSGGASGGSGGGASGAFDPCPPKGEACKILPLGDSITDGIGTNTTGGGYRVQLFKSSVADGKTITFVGGSANGPMMVDGMPFPRNHEGHSGWTIGQVDMQLIPDPALNTNPHIVLVHLGTNDMYQMPNGAADRLDTLVGAIVADQPNALVAVSNIIPFPQAASTVMTFNAAVPGVVKKHADAGKHVIFVDQFADFPTSELGDGVHPNQTGYERMGRKWYDAIKSYLH